MRWYFSLRAEIVNRPDNAAPEQVVPSAIHRHTCKQRIGRINQSARQSQTAAVRSTRGLRTAIYSLEETSRNYAGYLEQLRSY